MAAHTVEDGPVRAELDAPGGTVRVVVTGALPLKQCRARLASGPLFEMLSKHRPASAVLDLTNLTGDPTETLDFARTWWFEELVAIGCPRLTLIVPAKAPAAPSVIMFPRLRPATWPAADIAHGRRLSANQPTLANNPFVSVTLDIGGTRTTALRETNDTQDLLARALPALETFTPKVELRPLERESTTYAHVSGELAGELILSPKHMRAIQAQLGAQALAVAVPVVGLLFAIATSRGGGGEALRVFASYVNRYFALGDGISPLLFLVVDGDMVGALEALPALPKALLYARCEEEAQLYMDLRGMEPDRPRAVVPMGDQYATVFTVRPEGETETERIAFIIGEPNGVLGAGGVKGTSAIMAPSEFLTWADILAKRGPASPDGLAPAVRAQHKREITIAAKCVEEVLKFIPPGASAVPESAFVTDAAKRMYAKEPGRFSGARLEAVAGVYRKISEKF